LTPSQSANLQHELASLKVHLRETNLQINPRSTSVSARI
jgi:hypothetical protein